jgi:type VI secretion system secreted protein VgrG
MEEEGIFYFFRHAKESHKLVIADNKSSHHDIPGDASLIYDEVGGGLRDESRISSWAKTQELGPGKYSLQDYCFETPTANLYTYQDILPSTTVGKVTHKLKVAGNDQFVIYDYPGRYEKKPDGAELVKHSMEQLEMAQLIIRAESNAFTLIPGYRFSLSRHPNADGSYVVTVISHSASEGGFHSGTGIGDNH